MASKKFKGKSCAYCSQEGVSEVKEHVIAREFVLERYRANLPVVPACSACNTKKSALETYAMAVLPLGSWLPDAEEYINLNVERRLAKHPKLKRELGEGASRQWVRQNGLLTQVMTMPLQSERIDALVAMIVRGLFNFEFGYPLHRFWRPHPTNVVPAAEAALMSKCIDALGPGPDRRERVIGGDAVRYRVWRSRWMKYCSVWQLTMFGGLKVGGDEHFPDLAFDHWSVATFRYEDAPLPPEADEEPDVDGARAWMAGEGQST